MKSVSKLLVVAALLAGSASTAAYAQTGAPPPKKPANSTANTAGYTAPGSTEGGPAYVGPIMTEWGRKVTPENAWRSYPRPQMERDTWMNLNGHWDYAIRPAHAPQPAAVDGKILVPFAVESRLSGVARNLMPDDRRSEENPAELQSLKRIPY